MNPISNFFRASEKIIELKLNNNGNNVSLKGN
jgi:hypothetical protein